MKTVYKLEKEFRRGGEIKGIFVAEDEMVNFMIEEEMEVNFGEALGKHSEVIFKMDWDCITKVTDDPKVVDVIETYDLANGYDPFDHYATSMKNDYGFNIHDLTVHEHITKISEKKGEINKKIG